MSDDEEERMLVISTRTWFCLYLFEHQLRHVLILSSLDDLNLTNSANTHRLSLGTGRPMILHEDDSIKDSQEFLKHRG